MVQIQGEVCRPQASSSHPASKRSASPPPHPPLPSPRSRTARRVSGSTGFDRQRAAAPRGRDAALEHRLLQPNPSVHVGLSRPPQGPGRRDGGGRATVPEGTRAKGPLKVTGGRRSKLNTSVRVAYQGPRNYLQTIRSPKDCSQNKGSKVRILRITNSPQF